MAKVFDEALSRIAYISRIDVNGSDGESIEHDLQAVVGYAYRVCGLDVEVGVKQVKNINVFRDDVAHKSDEQSVVKQAPEFIQGYYVVPVALESKE